MRAKVVLHWKVACSRSSCSRCSPTCPERLANPRTGNNRNINFADVVKDCTKPYNLTQTTDAKRAIFVENINKHTNRNKINFPYSFQWLVFGGKKKNPQNWGIGEAGHYLPQALRRKKRKTGKPTNQGEQKLIFILAKKNQQQQKKQLGNLTLSHSKKGNITAEWCVFYVFNGGNKRNTGSWMSRTWPPCVEKGGKCRKNRRETEGVNRYLESDCVGEDFLKIYGIAIRNVFFGVIKKKQKTGWSKCKYITYIVVWIGIIQKKNLYWFSCLFGMNVIYWFLGNTFTASMRGCLNFSILTNHCLRPAVGRFNDDARIVIGNV